MDVTESASPPSGGSRVRLAATHSFGGFATLSARVRAHRYPPHTHDTFAIGVVMHGGIRSLECRGCRYALGPGSMMLINPDETHCTWLVEDDYAYRAVYPAPETLAAAAAVCGVGPAVWPERQRCSTPQRNWDAE
ncbi:MAG: AraC family ligand binding domain-containing protein [Pseudomonadota bacterium]